MKKRIRDALISGAVCVIILFSPMANGTGQVDFGGKYDDGDLYTLTSLDLSWESGSWKRDIEFDYRYQDKKDIRTTCLLYTSPSPRDRTRSRMPSSA